MAVKYIVEAHNRPIPFLLMGPPGRNKAIFRNPLRLFTESPFYAIGTGKTRTLVAAIAEIIKNTNNRVLVCANSNTACDEITERLLQVIGSGVYRMYAKAYGADKVSATIRPASNLVQGAFHFPSLGYLYQFQVLVCTLFTAGCLVKAREVDPVFNSSHFSHVIIDEGACVQEPVSMITIAGNYMYLHFQFYVKICENIQI